MFPLGRQTSEYQICPVQDMQVPTVDNSGQAVEGWTDTASWSMLDTGVTKEPSSLRVLFTRIVLDPSSWLEPMVEARENTFPTDDELEAEIIEQEMEHDVVVQLPPKQSYRVELEIKSTDKGRPVIIEPPELP